MKLVRVVRSDHGDLYHSRRFHASIQFHESMDANKNYLKCGLLFEVDDQHTDALLAELAEGNPGCEIRVYNLEKTGVCPAAALVMKQVSKDGILPVR